MNQKLFINFTLYIFIFIFEIKSKYTFVTLIYSRSFVIYGRVLGKSIQNVKNKNIDMIAMIPNENDLKVQEFELLEEVGWNTQLVSKISNERKTIRSDWNGVFTKLNIWNLTKYEKVIFLDADTLVVKNIDDLFNCSYEICAAPDIHPPDIFNAGVMVITPSENTYKNLLSKLTILDSYDGTDQGFLNSYFHFETFEAKQRLKTRDNANIYTYHLYPIGWPTNVRIIHYTNIPLLKPGSWISYPFFDLNWKWLQIRKQIPSNHIYMNHQIVCFIWTINIIGLLITIILFFMNQKYWNKKIYLFFTRLHGFIFAIFIFFLAFILSFISIPNEIWPIEGIMLWIFSNFCFITNSIVTFYGTFFNFSYFSKNVKYNFIISFIFTSVSILYMPILYGICFAITKTNIYFKFMLSIFIFLIFYTIYIAWLIFYLSSIPLFSIKFKNIIGFKIHKKENENFSKYKSILYTYKNSDKYKKSKHKNISVF